MNVSELLFSLEKSLHGFETRSDAKELSKLLSPTFFEFGSSGRTWTREAVLSRLPTEEGKTKIDSFDYKATELTTDIVLVTYVSKHLESNGNAAEFLRSSIWRKDGENWQMEFHQGTPKANSN
jgi:hypothetical protein